VLLLNTSADVGGAEITLLSLVDRLDPAKFAPVVVVPGNGPVPERLWSRGVRVETVRLHPLTRPSHRGAGILYGYYLLQGAGQVARLARQMGADVIHTHSVRAHLYGGLAGRRARIPVLCEHHDLVTEGVWKVLLNWCFRACAARIVANSAAVAAPFADHPVIGPKLQMVYPPTELERFDPATSPDRIRAELGLPSGPLVVGQVGQVIPWKGQREFLLAAAQVARCLPGARFLIVGDDAICGDKTYLPGLHALARELGIEDQVIFTGFREDIPELLAAMDVVVNVSWQEPFGKIVVEAAAMGKAVVATSIGGAPEILGTEGTAGWLVPPRNPEALAEALVWMGTHPEERQRMGEAAQERAQLFGAGKYVRRIESLYQEVSGGMNRTKDGV